MRILKCDICGYTQCPENNNADIIVKDHRDDFYVIFHDNQNYDLCKTCLDKYSQLKHDLTAAFIFYPDRKIEIKISEVKKNEAR